VQVGSAFCSSIFGFSSGSASATDSLPKSKHGSVNSSFISVLLSCFAAVMLSNHVPVVASWASCTGQCQGLSNV
jgi:hypothetical protein